MEYTYIISTIVASLMLAIIASPIGAKLFAKLQKHVEESNDSAIAGRYVSLDKRLITFIRVADVILLCGCVLTAIPFYDLTDNVNFIVYIVINVLVWAFSAVMWVSTYLESVQVFYDDEGFTVVNAFGFKKRYKRSDVVEISGERNKRIKFKKGSLLLFNAMLGLPQFLIYLQQT